MSLGSSQTLTMDTYVPSANGSTLWSYLPVFHSRSEVLCWVEKQKLTLHLSHILQVDIWGYGLVAITRKWPTHKQWNFLVSQNIFFGYNSTILSMKKTREVVIQKKLQLHWSSKLNYVCWWWGGDRFSVSMLCYLQLVSIFPFSYCTSTHIMSLCLVWKNRKKCQCNKLV